MQPNPRDAKFPINDIESKRTADDSGMGEKSRGINETNDGIIKITGRDRREVEVPFAPKEAADLLANTLRAHR